MTTPLTALDESLLTDVLEYLQQQQNTEALLRDVMEKGGEIFKESDQPIVSMRRRTALIERLRSRQGECPSGTTSDPGLQQARKPGESPALLTSKTETDWPPRFRVDAEGGLRLVLTMLREQRISVDQAMECFSRETSAEPTAVEVALRGLYWDQVDYLTLNKLGGLDNHWMRAAREALGIQRTTAIPGQPELRHDSPEIQFADVFDELDKGYPVNTRDAINALWWKVRNQRREIARLHTLRSAEKTSCSDPHGDTPVEGA